MARFKTQYDNPFEKQEKYEDSFSESLCDSKGYLDEKEQIQQMMKSGQLLSRIREDLFDTSDVDTELMAGDIDIVDIALVEDDLHQNLKASVYQNKLKQKQKKTDDINKKDEKSSEEK